MLTSLQAISTFVMSDIPSIILSPSSPTLISLLYSYGIYSGQRSPDFQEAWEAVIRAILSAPESPVKFAAIRNFLQLLPKKLDSLNPCLDLDAYILQIARLALEGKGDGWEIVNEALHVQGNLDVPRM
jgi:hypothetical protein